MSEVLYRFETRLRDKEGRRYEVQACGRAREDGMWEGWLEFLPMGGGEPVVTGRETTQPNRDDLLYWATGITDPYLDGALLRTLRVAPPTEVAATPGEPVAAGPRPRPKVSHVATSAAAAAQPPVAVLDPFRVYSEGDEVLRGQLGALSAGQLRNIIKAYELYDYDDAELEAMTEAELAALIMQRVSYLAE
jgi:hypothetical protein